MRFSRASVLEKILIKLARFCVFWRDLDEICRLSPQNRYVYKNFFDESDISTVRSFIILKKVLMEYLEMLKAVCCQNYKVHLAHISKKFSPNDMIFCAYRVYLGEICRLSTKYHALRWEFFWVLDQMNLGIFLKKPNFNNFAWNCFIREIQRFFKFTHFYNFQNFHFG